ncbi:hypothetical protein CT3_29920 [Comamonas terrigena NBRC 13299]|nr:hypothetical protein [Comamonas terrigena]BBL25537.1 hypothetical protein CT3_29920 [Comamonas terrigena NBRC 13299]
MAVAVQQLHIAAKAAVAVQSLLDMGRQRRMLRIRLQQLQRALADGLLGAPAEQALEAGIDLAGAVLRVGHDPGGVASVQKLKQGRAGHGRGGLVHAGE